MIWRPESPTCPAHMDDRPDGLQCQRRDEHEPHHGCTYEHTPADRTSEPTGHEGHR